MPVAAPHPDSSAFPTELIEFSRKVEEARGNKSTLWPKDGGEVLIAGEYFGAQLLPLHNRDVEALEALFQDEDIEAIDLNVRSALHLLWPELCWEDDPFEEFDMSEFDFLAEFL
ncbi:MAG: hypothetical protein AAGG51_00705 [Cyanobacteria bacterium P01_G01_bin.54]